MRNVSRPLLTMIILSFAWLISCGGGSNGNSPPIFNTQTVIPTGSKPESVAIGDLDGNGRPDLVMVTSYNADVSNDYTLFVFFQLDNGVLASTVKYQTDGTYSSPPRSVAIGDINGDGKNDIVVGLSGSGIDVFPQGGTGTFISPVIYGTADSDKIRIVDLNNDGLLDIVGIGWGTNTATIFIQDSSGALRTPVSYAVNHGGYDDLACGDVNNDGRTDVVVMSGQNYAYSNIGVLLQQTTGVFNSPVYDNIGSSILSTGVAVGDVNGDGRNDIVLTYGENRPLSNIAVLKQNLSGSLQPAVSYPSYDVPGPTEIMDLNADGRKDIVVLHNGWEKLGIYFQNPDGTILPEQLYTIPYASTYNPHGLALGDINSDGKVEAVIADPNNGLVILSNQ